MNERIVIDATVATQALSMPWWLSAFEELMQFGIVVVTLIVVLIRLKIVVSEWKSKRK